MKGYTPNQLPFYSPTNYLDPLYKPDHNAIFKYSAQFIKEFGIKPAILSPKKVVFLRIDMQKDFCYPTGTLFVAGRSGTGGQDASKVCSDYTYTNIDVISLIVDTMDTHTEYQVFYPSAHVYADGSPIPDNIFIPAEDYHSGKIKANPVVAPNFGATPEWLTQQFAYYCDQLESPTNVRPHYKLYIWPFHCMLGSEGHSLVGVIQESYIFHAWVRRVLNKKEVKGGSLFVENYSIFQPEVMTLFTGAPIPGVQRNVNLIKTMTTADIVVIGGVAGSHCEKFSVEDLKNEILTTDPRLADKVYILRDGTAPVVIKDASGNVILDCTKDQEDMFDTAQNAGMHVVNSTDPMESWPGSAAQVRG